MNLFIFEAFASGVLVVFLVLNVVNAINTWRDIHSPDVWHHIKTGETLTDAEVIEFQRISLIGPLKLGISESFYSRLPADLKTKFEEEATSD